MAVRGEDGMAGEGGTRASAGGCLLRIVFLWVEFTVFVVIAALVAEQVAPGLRARGYDTDIGTGFLIAAGLGGVAAIYPTLWLHRLGRRLARRA